MSVFLVLLGTVTIVPGCAALAFGWLPFWLSSHIERPRFWGLGMLGIGLFAVTHIPSLRVRFEDAGSAAVAFRYSALAAALIGMALSGGRVIRR